MDVDVSPELAPEERRALLAALERSSMAWRGAAPYLRAWRLEGLREAAERDDGEPGHAFSPRSTRGATRA